MLLKVITRPCLHLLLGRRKLISPGNLNYRGLLESGEVIPNLGQIWPVFSTSYLLHTSLLFTSPGIACRRLTAGHAVKPDTAGLCTSGKTGQDGSQHFSRSSDKLRPSSVEAAANHALEPLQGSKASRGQHSHLPLHRGGSAYAGTCEIKLQNEIHIQQGKVKAQSPYSG